ncbi:uncharacterized protein LOC122543347 isoform X4 [Chiloscyllium plagiosum]|uniref:uncharacterized protein LOC122543347 isoform X4 n=1 Tax=Chiloscyllium plagiosum TaxID=36176 RepID=UPI001CB84D59|nr:uncharacterized protein LOC122543347 isoform X4 [Chiloscyllium plagiosum]
MKPRSKFENFPPPELSTVRFRASFCQNSDRSMFCHSRARAGESSPMEHLQSSSPNSVIKNCLLSSAEIIGKMADNNVVNNGKDGAGQSTEDVCRDYLRNVCYRGKTCKYLHPDINEVSFLH